MPPTIANYNGSLIWHSASTPPKSWSSPSPLAPCNGTQQWHPGTQQWHHVRSPKVGRHPPPWHPAMAPSNGTPPNHSTLQWHPAMAPRPLRQSWPSPSPPTISHYNGTPRKHPAMAPRPLHPAMAPWCHVQSAKVVRRPPPLLEVRTPIAIAIWGKIRWIRNMIPWKNEMGRLGWSNPPLKHGPPPFRAPPFPRTSIPQDEFWCSQRTLIAKHPFDEGRCPGGGCRNFGA